jgi:hypothetical protein
MASQVGVQLLTSRSMIWIRSSSVSEVKRITSSRRLRNSGLKAFLTSLDHVLDLGGTPSRPPGWKPRCRASQEARAQVRGHDDDGVLEVDLLPRPSVNWPSSNTCSRMLKMSGCAFSISSSRMIEYGTA